MNRIITTARTFQEQLRTEGVTETAKRWWKHRGQIKGGRLVGVDKYGNKYYEDTDPNGTVTTISGRHRYVEYPSLFNYNASQIPAEWHSWLHYTTDLPSNALVEKFEPMYKVSHQENRTGTSQAYVPKNHMKNPNFDPKTIIRGDDIDISKGTNKVEE